MSNAGEIRQQIVQQDRTLEQARRRMQEMDLALQFGATQTPSAPGTADMQFAQQPSAPFNTLRDPLRATDTGSSTAGPSPADLMSRGKCAVCGQPVWTNQDRTKDEQGRYRHQACVSQDAVGAPTVDQWYLAAGPKPSSPPVYDVGAIKLERKISAESGSKNDEMAIPHSIVDMMTRAEENGEEPAFMLPALGTEDRRRSRDLLKQLHPVAVKQQPESNLITTTSTEVIDPVLHLSRGCLTWS